MKCSKLIAIIEHYFIIPVQYYLLVIEFYFDTRSSKEVNNVSKIPITFNEGNYDDPGRSWYK